MKSQQIETEVAASTYDQQRLETVWRQVSSLRFRVVQIEKTEKIRIESAVPVR